MRQIKVRVWVKPLKEMHDFDEIVLIDFERDEIHFAWWMNKFNECELMEFTGLKDKNGKEIYEGDVLQKGWSVAYCDGMNEFLGMSAGWYEQRDNFESWVSLEYDRDAEVIGNIYENRGLIEGI